MEGAMIQSYTGSMGGRYSTLTDIVIIWDWSRTEDFELRFPHDEPGDCVVTINRGYIIAKGMELSFLRHWFESWLRRRYRLWVAYQWLVYRPHFGRYLLTGQRSEYRRQK
jgi:hypothetical protein